MKFLADCRTKPVAISDIPRTPIHIDVNPGPTIVSTESVTPLMALKAIAVPAANNPSPGRPSTNIGFFC